MFFTYQKFYTEEELNAVSILLKSSDIPFEVEYGTQVLANEFIGGVHEPRFILKVQEKHFSIVDEIISNNYKINLNEIEKDYYLLSFTDDELVEVAHSMNDWGAYDKALAKKILEEKGIDYMQHKDALQTLDKYVPHKISNIVLVAQYGASILFTFVGVIIGVATLFSYKTLSNGKRMDLFDNSTRIHGSIILVIGIVRLLIYFFWGTTRTEM